jgi:site-specific recombinase XerD
VVPGEGLEPTSLLRAEDFKSLKQPQKSPAVLTGLNKTDLLNQFMQSREASNSSQSTLKYYRSKLDTFLDNVNHDTATPSDINRFLMKYSNAGNRHAYFRAIRAFYSWREDMFDLLSPIRKMKAPKVPKLIMPALKLEDIKKLIEQAESTQDRAMIALFTESGMRLSELAHIKLSDINWNQHTIRVIGKGRKERDVAFTQVSEVYIKQWLAEYNTNSQCIWNKSERSIEETLRKLEEKTGIKANPHVFRRSFATIMKSKGVDIAIIRQLGGWESLAMVERYTRSFSFLDALKHYKSPLQDLMTA